MREEKFYEIRTADGSVTLYSELYNEAMHTRDGAYTEAIIKHVLPSKVLERNDRILRVLDVGFGIGYNVIALLSNFLMNHNGRFLEVISIEKNPEALRMVDCPFDDEKKYLYGLIKHLLQTPNIIEENFSVTLFVGDARAIVQTLPDFHFHAIFHDPYSPAKNPELWTVDFFRQLHRTLSDDGILTTYSSAPQVRMALLEANFLLGKAPGMGKKREGTLAAKKEIIQPLPDEALSNLRAHKRAVPYRDETLSASREEILHRFSLERTKRFE
ncbi:MAG: MnmC family methyltransferase [Spirochaetes bacterium]|nr:MnmC family methyltransferase [Spirochaetota bacterium]